MTTTVLEPWSPEPETLEVVWSAKEFAEAMHPVTVRQTFYHLVTKDKIQNTMSEYKRLVDILTKARLAGFIPFEWIVDLSRRPLKVSLYPNIGNFLKDTTQYYYRDIWENQPVYVMIWLEKEALQNIVWSIASQYYIPVYPARGYSSYSFILDGAEDLAKHELGKKRVILYLGDYDPSGQDMPRDLLKRLKQFGVEVDLVKVALTREQVEEYKLPHQPLKEQDPRREKSGLEYGVELDALDPDILRGLIQTAIENFLDLSSFDADKELERREKTLLEKKMDEIANEPQEDEDCQVDFDEDKEEENTEDEEEDTGLKNAPPS